MSHPVVSVLPTHQVEGHMTMETPIPSDWFPDPTGRNPERYWDGGWTARVRTDATAEEAEDPIPDAARAYLRAPDVAPIAADAPPKRSRRGWLIAGVAGAVVLAIVVAIAASGSNNLEKTAAKASGQPDSHVSERNSNNGSLATASTTTPPVTKVNIAGQGFTQLPPNSIGTSYVSWAVLVDNPSKTQAATSVSLTIAFYDSSGTVVGSQNENLAVILPGQRAAVGDHDQIAGATRMSVQALVGRWQPVTTTVGSFSAEGVNISADRFSFHTRGELVSTFAKDLQQVKAVAVYYDGAGNIIGGDFTYVNFVPAGGRTAVDISDLSVVPGVARADIVASITNLSLLQAGS
jgi:hypothetical protein